MRIKTYTYTAQEWPCFLQRLLRTHRHVCRVFPEAQGHPWNNPDLLKQVLERQVPGYRGHLLAVAYDDYGQPLGFLALHLYDDYGPGEIAEAAFSLYDFQQAPTCPVELFVPLAQATGYCVFADYVKRDYLPELLAQVGGKCAGDAYGCRIKLPDTFDEYLKSLDKKHRSSHRSVLRRYQHLQVEEFEFSATDTDYELFNRYCDRWHGADSSISTASRLSQMVKVFPLLPARQALRIYDESKLVGVNLSYTNDSSTLQDHLFFYDREYRGLGEFAILQNIQQAISKGFKMYDLGTGDARTAYKKRFLPKESPPQPAVKIGTWVDAGFKDKGAVINQPTARERDLFSVRFGEAKIQKLYEDDSETGYAHRYLNRHPALRKIVGPLTFYQPDVVIRGSNVIIPLRMHWGEGVRAARKIRTLFSGPTTTVLVGYQGRYLVPSVALTKGEKPEFMVTPAAWKEAASFFQKQGLALARPLLSPYYKGPFLRKVMLPQGAAYGVFALCGRSDRIHLLCFHAPRGQAPVAITQFARYWAYRGFNRLTPELTPEETLAPPSWWHRVENVVWKKDREIV